MHKLPKLSLSVVALSVLVLPSGLAATKGVTVEAAKNGTKYGALVVKQNPAKRKSTAHRKTPLGFALTTSFHYCIDSIQ
jgi:hypothetical protein